MSITADINWEAAERSRKATVASLGVLRHCGLGIGSALGEEKEIIDVGADRTVVVIRHRSGLVGVVTFQDWERVSVAVAGGAPS